MNGKQFKRLSKNFEKFGGTVIRRTSGHYTFRCPCGSRDHTAGKAGTPSDHRSEKNFLAALRRCCGFDPAGSY